MSGSIFSHFDSGIIVEQDECHTSYKQKLVGGEGIASVFPVLPGIEVIDLNFHASHYIIFYGMYAIPVQARSVYYRLKVQELLLYLHYFDTANEKQKRIYTRQQVDIVKQIQKRITGEPGRRFTIEELANEYYISPTTLKSNFKGVYGVSIAAYMKEYRIRQSLTLLRHTQRSVAEIALEMGYESQSKFGVAFKEIMKITPLEYRKKVCT